MTSKVWLRCNVAPEEGQGSLYWWKTEHFYATSTCRVKMAGLCADKQYRVHGAEPV